MKFMLLLVTLGLFMHSSWVLSETACPALNSKPINQGTFMQAHGIAGQENYSIWLKEHSVWRKKNQKELQNYSFIPKPAKPGRQP
ncbi:MAG: hypothetical protein WA666_08665 [Nitrospirota bacterium]